MLFNIFFSLFLIFESTSFCTMMLNGNILIRNSRHQDNQETTVAATYIPFIMSLIKPKLTPKEKLNIAQNVYNSFQKKQQEEKMRKEKEENKNNGQHVIRNKSYLLRF